MARRASGVLLHLTSLSGPFGIGDLGRPAFDFLDWLVDAGQQVWQVLPVGPTGPGSSPYNAVSAFAGNPLLISPASLVDDELLPESDLSIPGALSSDRVDFAATLKWKEELLRRSWQRFLERPPPAIARELAAFTHAPEQTAWLDDWSLYAAVRAQQQGRAWVEWPPELRRREPDAVARARNRLAPEVDYQRYLQFLFSRQWSALKCEANRKGLKIFGDLPFYVALDSAEVWSRSEQFQLGEDGRPLRVAGVPPDYFSETGQLWGNPLYRWDQMATEGYRWWIDRLRRNLHLVDLLRVDHFRGFAGYWEVDAAESSAVNGRWVKGPGLDFFKTVEAALGQLPLVAEDLGLITPDVRRLRRDLGLPGMKVLQFGFLEADSEHLPHHVTPDTVYYTGTHDNDTAIGWFERIQESERRRALDYLDSDGSAIHQDLMRAVLDSAAELSVIPMQDVLGLDNRARMNTPGVSAGNWEWRLSGEQLSSETARRLRDLTERSGRLPAT